MSTHPIRDISNILMNSQTKSGGALRNVKSSYVGILLNRDWYRGIPTGKTRHEALLQYVRTARIHGLTPCFIQLSDLKPGASKVAAYVYMDWKFVRKLVPLPAVIHNRAIYKSSVSKAKLHNVAACGTIVYNACNRYSKGYIHKLLMKREELRVHLPETEPATAESVEQLMLRHPSLIIKPDNGSIGKGIMLISQGDDGNWKLRLRKNNKFQTVMQWEKEGRLPLLLINQIKEKKYLVQQRLPLATRSGRPFDIRVSVQRCRSGEWQVTGMIGKVAAARSFLTNVAQGGQVYPLERILEAYPQLNLDTVRQDISRFSLLVAIHLSKHLPELADIGLDVGITEHGFPMFIECNGRDLRYSFLRGGMLEEWTRTYANPMGYAAYLLEQRREAAVDN